VRKKMRLFLVSLLIFMVINVQLDCALGGETSLNMPKKERSLIFSTWEGFEVDKCASIWLIKRFINLNAVIKFFPKGEVIKEGIPFDTPDAQLKRYHNMSTFECMLTHYRLKDPKLIYIGKIIHDIEVNIWERKVLKETPDVQNTIIKIIMESKSNDEIIKRSCEYFDLFYKKLNSQLKTPS